ncbi:hypothetical protein WCWAEYFT_CDS0315 [Vibrio phage VB_VaC_TDDLMA]
MLNFNVTTGQVITSSEVMEFSKQGHEILNRNKFKTLESAQKVCEQFGEDTYMVVDKGEYILPRFDVIEKPRVGDKVSYAFNGDSTPCGEIKSISKSLKVITTTDGQKFYRKGLSGTWKYNKTWSLISGHQEERNPHI